MLMSCIYDLAGASIGKPGRCATPSDRVAQPTLACRHADVDSNLRASRELPIERAALTAVWTHEHRGIARRSELPVRSLSASERRALLSQHRRQKWFERL